MKFIDDLVEWFNKQQEKSQERAEANERSNRHYFSVHCPYCGGQTLYKKNEIVYCDDKSCPNRNKPVDIDRYNLRRFIH